MDVDSNTIWSKSYEHLVDRGIEHSIIIDDDNGFLIASTLGDGFSLANSDILLIKTGENGDEMWMKTYGGKGNDQAKSIIKTSDNNLLILGTTQSYGYGQTDIMVVKTDSQGNEFWSKTYGGTDYDTASQIREMEDGNFIICGAIKGNEGLTDFDPVIIKIDQNGKPF
jgi:regulation of enolase protein 1 (concanavalin A-like superfamily)